MGSRNIFDRALKGCSSNASEKNADKYSTVLVVGSKQGGKTTMINRFREKGSEAVKPTMALEYTFARQSRANDLGKNVVHIWELGGGTLLAQMIENVITSETVSSVACVVAVDLSRPRDLWRTIDVFLKAIRSRVDKVFSGLIAQDSPLPQELRKRAWERLGEDHADKDVLDPMPVPVRIVGLKYDKFRDLEPEEGKTIARTLRYIAHVNGADLQFTSDTDEGLRSRSKALFHNLAFSGGVGGSRRVVLDHHQPLEVPVGSDSLAQIGVPTLHSGDDTRISARNPIELWRAAYDQVFPPQNPTEADDAPQPNPTTDRAYAEASVDDMREQKDEELARYRRQSERRYRELAAKREAATSAASVKPRKPAGGPRSATRRPRGGNKVDVSATT